MLKSRTLRAKFTKILGLLFLCGSLISFMILAQVQNQSAQAVVTQQSMTLMSTLNALRNEYSTQIVPLLDEDLDQAPSFVPETVPSYVVRQVFEAFRTEEKFQNYFYKDAAPNPTNPRDQADEFEFDLVQRFSDNPDLDELHGFRQRDRETVYYVAHPLRLTESSCLICHSTPEVAPANLIETYGAEGGFGWQLDEIIAAQVIYLPATQILWIARRNTLIAILIFMGIFGIALIFLNRLLTRTVIAPLAPMTRVATPLSYSENQQPQTDQRQEEDLEQLRLIGQETNELGQLARVFHRMARIIYSREKNLWQKLQDTLNQVDNTPPVQGLTLDAVRRLIARSRRVRLSDQETTENHHSQHSASGE
jgi:hypothetical protein